MLHLVGFHSLDTLYIGLHASTPYSCPIVTKLESSSTDFRQITQIPNFIKIRPVGAELSHTDGQTDMTEANGRFPQRKRALKKTLYFRTEFKVKKKKAETYSSTSTIFYPTTRMVTSLTLFRVMTGIATLAAIPVHGEPGTIPFTESYYSSY